MSEHRADVEWQRRGGAFDHESFDRTHRWSFPGGSGIDASSAPEYSGRADLPNPEQALAVALSSCHMLTFLSLAARKRWLVESYRDEASAWLGKNADGRLAVTKVVLRPRIAFGGSAPASEAVAQLHEQAHKHCFVANSVRCEVLVEPQT
jgi:organic hydroperoxide reductase OsmC/OhrA